VNKIYTRSKQEMKKCKAGLIGLVMLLAGCSSLSSVVNKIPEDAIIYSKTTEEILTTESYVIKHVDKYIYQKVVDFTLIEDAD
jgi:hypothetical protein